MSDNAQRAVWEKKTGDMAVDGLIAGILAGLGMAAYLVLVGLITSIPPAVTLGRFDPGPDGRWLTGMLAHLAVSGIYGVIFALLFSVGVRLRPSLLRFGWLLGLAYGLVLFALARGVLLAAVGSSVQQISVVHLLIAHAVYGLVLGFEVHRKW